MLTQPPGSSERTIIPSHSPRTETPEAIQSSRKAGNTSYMQHTYLAVHMAECSRNRHSDWLAFTDAECLELRAVTSEVGIATVPWLQCQLLLQSMCSGTMYSSCTSLAGALPFATCTKELEPQMDNFAIFHVVHSCQT